MSNVYVSVCACVCARVDGWMDGWMDRMGMLGRAGTEDGVWCGEGGGSGKGISHHIMSKPQSTDDVGRCGREVQVHTE